jgi:hypothetical protein
MTDAAPTVDVTYGSAYKLRTAAGTVAPVTAALINGKRKASMTRKPDITQEELRQAFDYNEKVGDLCWKYRPANNVKVGVPVRAKNTDGYYHVGFKRKVYTVHRIIWMLVYGEWPDAEIDHVNCDKNDNRLENLRLATKGQNQSNSHKRDGFTSLYKGVCWNDRSKKWRAQVTHDNKVVYLGEFTNQEDAHEAYCRVASGLKGEFVRLS